MNDVVVGLEYGAHFPGSTHTDEATRSNMTRLREIVSARASIPGRSTEKNQTCERVRDLPRLLD